MSTATVRAGYVDIITENNGFASGSNFGNGTAYTPGRIARLTGAAGDAAGHSLAYTDIDQDGLSDLLVGAPYSNVGSGSVYLVNDMSAVKTGDLHLNYVHLDTSIPESWLGFAMASCDLDGDGLDEIAVSAPGDATNQPGRVYILDPPFAGVDFDNVSTLDIASVAAYWIEDTQNALNNLGQTLHCGHDLDNDNNPDLIVADPHNASVYALIGARDYTGAQDIHTIMTDPNYHSTTFLETGDNELGTKVVTGHLDPDITADLCFTSPETNSGDGQLLCFSGEGF